MDVLTIADLAKDAEREFRAAFRNPVVVTSCETFGELNYRGGFRLTLADASSSCEVLYSDLQLEVHFNGKEVFGIDVHEGFEGNMFSRENLREYLPRIAASAAAQAKVRHAQG